MTHPLFESTPAGLTCLGQVCAMHEIFGMTSVDVPFSSEEKTFRAVALLEEITEFLVAKKPEDELDALVDLMVFALGTVDRMGFAPVFHEAFRRVMKANCNKTVGPNQKRGSFKLDLVKPTGWKPAILTDLVENSRHA